MISIRKMKLSDLPQIDALQHESYIEELWEDMSLFQKILEGYAHSSFVAEKDGALLGYLLTYPSVLDRDDFEDGWSALRGTEEHIYVHDLCVHPKTRGMGVAGLLWSKLDESAAEKGFSKFVGIAVQDSMSFWEKLGFLALKPRLYHGEPGMLMIRKNK